jgi:predicted metal-dependent hydrolase
MAAMTVNKERQDMESGGPWVILKHHNTEELECCDVALLLTQLATSRYSIQHATGGQAKPTSCEAYRRTSAITTQAQEWGNARKASRRHIWEVMGHRRCGPDQ